MSRALNKSEFESLLRRLLNDSQARKVAEAVDKLNASPPLRLVVLAQDNGSPGQLPSTVDRTVTTAISATPGTTLDLKVIIYIICILSAYIAWLIAHFFAVKSTKKIVVKRFDSDETVVDDLEPPPKMHTLSASPPPASAHGFGTVGTTPARVRKNSSVPVVSSSHKDPPEFDALPSVQNNMLSAGMMLLLWWCLLFTD